MIEDDESGIGETKERAVSTQNSDQTQGLQGGDDRNPNIETRPPRVPMKQGTNLGFEDCEFDHKKFRYYGFHEDPLKPGRIARAKAAYWENVTNINGQTAQRATGGGITYLMCLLWKYANEDLQVKKNKVLATMADQGKLGANEYAPDSETGRAEGGTSIHQSSHTSDNPYS
jgi:hypothetical protein